MTLGAGLGGKTPKYVYKLYKRGRWLFAKKPNGILGIFGKGEISKNNLPAFPSNHNLPRKYKTGGGDDYAIRHFPPALFFPGKLFSPQHEFQVVSGSQGNAVNYAIITKVVQNAH
ncbi:hypothetical protein COU01_02915 [Candidatus Falkowbacteria bacterium CG10_big_fil_rev_8_21_14_0_10_44_15]|uniref:Uncharacterized protein n=1 Tax=Candidatus Falkowbacteria bacterium CG10_big_fil_rev_8_21_14_0_10_44_15 TaxID=1974569 RepID=A0A2H0UZF9_9BACT|nr:MAG: hypothetical protein COU01_02915 [Candidatus Falkowbacteria bacterium CG10_big_fil_rev_8_21_14_0_10_44_15]